jgi:hypothetical protein
MRTCNDLDGCNDSLMRYIKLELSKKTVDEKVAQGKAIKAGMTGNANFPTPTPSLACLGDIIATLAAKKVARDRAFEAARAATADLHAAEQAYDLAASQLGAYAEGAVGSDVPKLEAVGFPLRKAPEPIVALDMVTDLKVTSNSYSGTLFARWKPLRGTKTYEVQLCADPAVDAHWRSIKPSPSSSTTIEGLVPGTKMWVRVRGVAKKIVGPWSQPACKVVP